MLNLRAVSYIAYFCILFAITTIADASQQLETVRLRPRMRAEKPSDVLFSVKTSDIEEFLENIIVFSSKADYEALPYVIAFSEEQDMGATGDKIYVGGVTKYAGSEYNLLRGVKELVDPLSKQVLGYETQVIGRAELQETGSMATMLITRSFFPTVINTKLMPRVGLELPSIIDVRAPKQQMEASVISVEYESAGSGNNTVIVINVGAKQGVELGNLFDLIEDPRYVEDPVSKQQIELPLVKFGEVMVYQVFDNLSLGLITLAKKPVDLGDKLVSTSNTI